MLLRKIKFRARPASLRLCLVWLLLLGVSVSAHAAQSFLTGTVSDPTGRPIAAASIELTDAAGHRQSSTTSDSAGAFRLSIPAPGAYQITVRAQGFQSVSRQLLIAAATSAHIAFTLTPGATESVTVTSNLSEVDLFSPDPVEKVFVQQDLIDANPGRPGAPVSIPGYPIETASGGIKAPQYFAPGVAGDHGEPIAQFISIGGYLLPNNLSANAHGNGYADPNILIAPILADVQVDGGAFNVLEGNHSVNLAATYGLRADAAPELLLTGDYRDIDLVAIAGPAHDAWLAVEASYGNGFLARLEHRQQYKLNAQRILDLAAHRLTLFATAYYGTSFVPGLVPIRATANDGIYINSGDTIDPRQRDQTHTAILAANDEWTLDARQQFQLSAFFRTYNLALFSDFGQGLIRQSEFRTVAGATANYSNRIAPQLSLLAGLDYEREAPRRDDLDHYDFYTGNAADGAFTPVTANNVTISPVAPYIAFQGALGAHLRYYAGWRRDQIDFVNTDLLAPQNSFAQWVGVNSPKATVSLLPGPARFVPLIAASFGESFFTEDPRIGTGSARPTPVSRNHSYQLVASKTVSHTQMKLTLGHVTTAEQLAKIDPDTGLQEDQGPGVIRFLTAALQQRIASGSVLVTFSKADARDLLSGQPTAEAPRTMLDILGLAQHLPLRLQAKAEFEFVPAKPLGTGCAPDPSAQCTGVPVREFRAELARSFRHDRFNIGINLLAASGYTGQTLEILYPSAIPVPTGVRIPSYVSATFAYRFGPRASR
jgi:hypothetical protein